MSAPSPVSLDAARAVADAVLYEGYLLYPYRSTSSKNQLRWQFGVLGPPGAAAAGFGEDPDQQTQCLLRTRLNASLIVYLRFLHLQHRAVERPAGPDAFAPVERLDVAGSRWISWDEAVPVELQLGPFDLTDGLERSVEIEVTGSRELEPLTAPDGGTAGRLVRTRAPLSARLHVTAELAPLAELAGGPEPDGAGEETGAAGRLIRLTIRTQNTGDTATSGPDALSRSLIGTHLLLAVQSAHFLSLTDPPPGAATAAQECEQRRCWPVLTGAAGSDDLVLASPIILYDHPELAAQSAGDLFDATEIDEILTLRVLTMTDEEKAQARATDARAAAIIDRCEQLPPDQLQRLHGVLRDPQAGRSALTGDDWWAAEAAAPVTPETDSVSVAGVHLRKGSRVRLHPSRRADAQDIFYAGQDALVSAVHTDLDGVTHVAVTLLDDPAAEFHDWYGRYLYFAPDELEPLEDAGHHRSEEKSP